MILINFQLFNYLRTFQILLVCHSPMSIEPQNEIKLGLYLVWLESMQTNYDQMWVRFFSTEKNSIVIKPRTQGTLLSICLLMGRLRKRNSKIERRELTKTVFWDIKGFRQLSLLSLDFMDTTADQCKVGKSTGIDESHRHTLVLHSLSLAIAISV